MPNNPLLTPAPTPFPNFGEWLTYAEAIKSQTAIRKGIRNLPTLEQYNNMVTVYVKLYEPLCRHFGKKLPVSSFFRSVALNKAVGGSATSAHCNGQAIDIDCDGLLNGPTNNELFAWASTHLEYDQLIKEAPDPVTGVAAWIHLSFRAGNNRRQRLVMRWVNGKQIYQAV